jgi:hypothetical protein
MKLEFAKAVTGQKLRGGGPLASVLLALLLLPAAFSLTACPKGKNGKPATPSGKAIIAGVNAGVDEFARAIPALGLSEDEARVLSAAFEEARLSAPLAERFAGFGSLTRAQRARLAADVAEHLSGAASRLSEKNIGLKSEKAKKKLAEYRARIGLAVFGLRVYAAAVEAGEDPDATPSPTPAK